MKKIAIIFGSLFVLTGILGFVPAATPDGHLFGLFHVNAFHNMVHLITGAIAIAVGLMSDRAAIYYFRTFGIVYGLVAIMGFMRPNEMILGMAHNMADAWLHALVAVVSLMLGFSSMRQSTPTHPSGLPGTT
jgi:hypothetical protein